jgi:hypothetical protein
MARSSSNSSIRIALYRNRRSVRCDIGGNSQEGDHGGNVKQGENGTKRLAVKRDEVENVPQLRFLIQNLDQVRSPCHLCEIIAQPLRARTLWPALLSRRLRRWQSLDPDAAVNAFRYGARASDHGRARPRKAEPVAPYLARFRARFSAQSEECQDSQENDHKPDDR